MLPAACSQKNAQVMTQAIHAASPPDPAHPALTVASLPAVWSAQVNTQLASDEKILASLEIDLDARLRFATGVVVVTSERLLVMSADDSQWQS